MLRFLDAHQVDLPTRELGGEANVLAAAADRHCQILFVDDDIHAVTLLIDHDARDLGRRERVDDQLRGILREQNDVDALAGKLVGDRGHARAAHANTRSLRIEPRIVGLDRDLRAHAGIAGGGLDLDQALFDFRNFKLEQTDQQVRRDARQHQLRAACLRLDLDHVGANAVAHPQILLRDDLVARDHALDAARFNDHVAALDALDGPSQQIVLALQKIVEDLLPLGVANLLHDDLLCRLRADATEIHRLQRLLDHVADLQLGIALGCVGDRDLVRRFLVLLVGHNGPAAKRLVIAGLAIDRHSRVDVLREALLGCGCERRLQRREDDVLGDVLFARQRVDEQQQLAIHPVLLRFSIGSGHGLFRLHLGHLFLGTARAFFHFVFLHSIFGTSRALSMLARGIARLPVSVSTTTASPSRPRSTPFIRLALSTLSRNVSFTSSPAKRAKSAAFLSARSSPGEETSRRSYRIFSTANRCVR